MLNDMLAASLLTLPMPPPPRYDLVVRDGRVLDGAGNPPFRADIGVRRGRIAAIGQRLGPGRIEVNARGKIVAPGFIDVHTHGEDIERLPLAENFIRQGVTTIILGNCGESRSDLGRYFGVLDRTGIAPNVASLIGHGTVRGRAMGGSFSRRPTDAEMDKMKGLVDRAMRAGALGMSTGLIYQPGVFGTTEELIELSRVVARYDGIYTSHMRSEGNAILAALAEVFAVAEGAGVRCEVSHIKLSGNNNWGRAAEILGVIAGARARGLDITQDQYVYTASSTTLSQLLPQWARVGGADGYRARLADPQQKGTIVEEMKAALAGRGKDTYDWVTITSCQSDPALNGRSIPEAARQRIGKDDLDAQIQLILDLHGAGSAGAVFHGIGEEDLQVFLKHPNTMIGSDSGVREFGKDVPHPRGYGAFARVLGRYVRELGVLSLEDAVRKMTSLPAVTFRIEDRGLIRERMWADLVVFDPDTVTDRATFREPHQYAEGIDYVLINGMPVVADGKPTGARPGKTLRRRAPR